MLQSQDGVVFKGRKRRLHLRNNHLPRSLDYTGLINKKCTNINLDLTNLYMHSINNLVLRSKYEYYYFITEESLL